MRVGLFGNMANNAYNVTKLLRKRGVDANLVLDPHDHFAMSQPIWEDCDLVLDSELLMGGGTNHDLWLDKARQVHWDMPEWVIDLGGEALSRGDILRASIKNPTLTVSAALRAGRSREAIKFALKDLNVVRALSEFDFLFVYGLGPAYAYLSSVPFAVIPYGADVSIVPFQDNFLSKMQRKGYEGARKILVCDPDYIASLHRMGLSDRWMFFPYPVDTDKYAPLEDRRGKEEALQALPMSVGGRFIFFMPSRQDFYWKGTDKALKAFSRLSRNRDDVLLITPSWGVDTGGAIEIVRKSGGGESVMFLPYAMSKPRLIKYLRAADVVLDQFVLGSYGTSTIEALACGKPVITHIDAEKYRAHLPSPPPVLQACGEEEIFNRMRFAVETPGALHELGKCSRSWILDQHSVRSLETLENFISQTAKKSPTC